MKKKEKLDGLFIFVSATLIFHIALMVFLCFVPIIFDFHIATAAGRAFMIIGSVLFFLLFFSFVSSTEMIWNEEKGQHNQSTFWEWRVFYVLFFLFSIYLVLRYFHETIWGTLGYSTVAIFGAIVVYGFFCILKVRNRFFNNEKLFMIFIAVTSLILLSGLVLLDSGLSGGETLSKVAIGLYYLLFTTILIFKAITNQRPNKRHQIVLLMTYILIFMAILISFPFYVNWCGISGKYFDTFTAVYSAVIGGGLTLVGVAWTIRKGDEDRKADRLQVEADRKEEARKKLMPYLKYSERKPDECSVVKSFDWEINRERIEIDDDRVQQNTTRPCKLYGIAIDSFCVKNITENIVVFIGIRVNGEFYKLVGDLVAESKECTYFALKTSFAIDSLKPITALEIICSDILGNQYSFDCTFTIVEQQSEVRTKGDLSLVFPCFLYGIKEIGLPKLEKIQETTNE